MNIYKKGLYSCLSGAPFATLFLVLYAGKAMACIDNNTDILPGNRITCEPALLLRLSRDNPKDAYIKERQMYSEILDMITHKTGEPRPEIKNIENRERMWLKEIVGKGYVGMLANENGIYLFYFEQNLPHTLGFDIFRSWHSQATKIGRYSTRLNQELRLKS